MALIHQLLRGELGRWFRHRMPGTEQVAAQVAAAAAQVAPLCPSRRYDLGPRHWAEVGGTFGGRMAAVVEQAPPYYGLMGLVAPGLLTRAAAHRIAAGYPSHRHLHAGDTGRALDFRPTRAGWRDLDEPWPPDRPPGWADAVVTELAARTHDYHARHAPTGTVGPVGVERGLARSYGWWSAAEDIYRSGTISEDLDALLAVDEPTVEHLRALTTAAAVDETARLAERLRTSGTLRRLHELAGRPSPGAPLGFAGPTFVPHWADGDLLVGDTLIDVKTVMRAQPAPKVAPWLWQVLAYAWLDTPGDRYRIRAVALYLSRHGVLIRWPVHELASRLLAGPRTCGSRAPAARAEFLALAGRLAAGDGALIDP
jgi:hypothetical protein